MMKPTRPKVSEITTRATRVINQLMVSIITNTPTTVMSEVIICVRLWLSV